jgi:hypothetical protein
MSRRCSGHKPACGKHIGEEEHLAARLPARYRGGVLCGGCALVAATLRQLDEFAATARTTVAPVISRPPGCAALRARLARGNGCSKTVFPSGRSSALMLWSHDARYYPHVSVAADPGCIGAAARCQR